MSSEGMQVGRVELVSMGRIVILFGLELEPGCSFRVQTDLSSSRTRRVKMVRASRRLQSWLEYSTLARSDIMEGKVSVLLIRLKAAATAQYSIRFALYVSEQVIACVTIGLSCTFPA
jgi:hypothetical protein